MMYTVKERIEETGGKDYSIFDVISPEGVTVASYSALDYGGGAEGVDNAEYNALEKRIELNAELRAKGIAQPVDILAEKNQRIAELEAFVSKVQIELTAFAITDESGKVIGISFDRALGFQREAMGLLDKK